MVIEIFVFASESNPKATYQTLVWDDGALSCDCKGWTRRCNNGVRTCKHVRLIETSRGLARAHALSHKVLSGKALVADIETKPKVAGITRVLDFN